MEAKTFRAKANEVICIVTWVAWLLGTLGFFIGSKDSLHIPWSVRWHWMTPCYATAFILGAVFCILNRKDHAAQEAVMGAMGGAILGFVWGPILDPFLPEWLHIVYFFAR